MAEIAMVETYSDLIDDLAEPSLLVRGSVILGKASNRTHIDDDS